MNFAGKRFFQAPGSCRVEKRFRWFFTYYSYTETLPSYSIYRHEPIDSFFTPAEIDLMKEEQGQLLDKRVEELWSRNIVDELIERLQAKAQELNDPELPPSAISESKRALTERFSKERTINRRISSAFWKKLFRPRPAKKLRGAIDTIFMTMTNDLNTKPDLNISYKNEVTLPGILVTSNSKKIEGNKIMWDCRSEHVLDVVMSAESRRVNLWALIVTRWSVPDLLLRSCFPFSIGQKDEAAVFWDALSFSFVGALLEQREEIMQSKQSPYFPYPTVWARIIF